MQMKMIPISYGEYLRQSEKRDCRESWVDWKVEWEDMSRKDAEKESNEKSIWGYKPIKF